MKYFADMVNAKMCKIKLAIITPATPFRYKM
jgi:hypothetical protein